jgi:hypothetical protein
MPASHIAGVPVEETLLSLGGPAAIYLVVVGVAVAMRNARLRLRTLRRHRPEAHL